MADSDSDYIVEEYIRPEKVSVPLRNGGDADILGNFNDIPKESKAYDTFPEEVFHEDYDHDKEFKPLDGEPMNISTCSYQINYRFVSDPKKKAKEKTPQLKKKIRKKVLAKIGREKKLKLVKGSQ